MNSQAIPAKFPEIPLWRSAVVAALAIVLFLIYFWLTPPLAQSEAGVNMDLPSSVGRFWGTKQEVSEGERVILPPDTEFAKKLYSDGQGDDINCQIVLAGAAKRSIHQPEICLPAQGWTIRANEAIPVQLASGETLMVKKLTISRPVMLKDGRQKELTSYFLYWFVGKNITTPHHVVRLIKTNIDVLLHNTNHRWAYVIVSSPILEGFTSDGKNAEQTLDMLKSFVGDIAPDIIKK